jgi:hypothetical protein
LVLFAETKVVKFIKNSLNLLDFYVNLVEFLLKIRF